MPVIYEKIIGKLLRTNQFEAMSGLRLFAAIQVIGATVNRTGG
jgi:hypothetical protein